MTTNKSDDLSPRMEKATDYKQMRPGKGYLIDKATGFVTIDPATEFQARSTLAGEGSFMAPSRKLKNIPTSHDDESHITITYPGVIEDLIEQSERRLEKKLMKRIQNLSENSEQNVTDLY